LGDSAGSAAPVRAVKAGEGGSGEQENNIEYVQLEESVPEVMASTAFHCIIKYMHLQTECQKHMPKSLFHTSYRTNH
jgi:hypothetical protein